MHIWLWFLGAEIFPVKSNLYHFYAKDVCKSFIFSISKSIVSVPSDKSQIFRHRKAKIPNFSAQIDFEISNLILTSSSKSKD